MDEFQITQGIRVELQKFIPVAAGMAGGSSDAAAAMIGVNRLFDLGLSVKELMERGVKVGADVPYCLTAFCGERLWQKGLATNSVLFPHVPAVMC